MVSAINEDLTSGPWFGAPTVAITGAAMDKSVTMEFGGDMMPPGNLYGTRDKVIHSIGSIGQVSWVSTGDHPYTGLFKGSDKCLARFSLAGEPKAGSVIAPGVGFKCVRDGMDSGNFVLSNSPDGQMSRNFFKLDLSNHIPVPSPALNAGLGLAFSSASMFIGYVGLSNFATYGVDGRKEDNPVFPYMISFRATDEVPQLPDEDTGVTHTEMFATITKGTNLYDVFALDVPEPMGGKYTKIATIHLDEKATTSKWGDGGFFIRHQRMDEDLVLKPEWAEHSARFGLTGGAKYNSCSAEVAPLDQKCPWSS